MAEKHKEREVSLEEGEAEVKDRGLFDFFGKEVERPQEEQEVLVARVEKIQLEEEKKADEQQEEDRKKHGLVEKLHRSHSTSSSSSSDEEEVEGEGGIKEKIKKKKKELKEKIEKKLHGGEEEKKEQAAVEDTTVVVEKVEALEGAPPAEQEEKKGFLEKIKEKLPGGYGKGTAEEGTEAAPPAASPAPAVVEGAGELGKGQEGEKKGFLGRIIEKLPGYHKHAGEEGEKNPAGH